MNKIKACVRTHEYIITVLSPSRCMMLCRRWVGKLPSRVTCYYLPNPLPISLPPPHRTTTSSCSSRHVTISHGHVTISHGSSHLSSLPLFRSLSSTAPEDRPRPDSSPDITFQEGVDDQINVSKLIRQLHKDVSLAPKGDETNTLTSPFWVERKVAPRDLHKVYLQLSKRNLTCLVVLTAIAGYAFNPASGSLYAFSAMTAGTWLCSASANTCNQVMEAPYDSQMDRCKTRSMVTHVITPIHALGFAVASGVVGTGLLYSINPLTAALGVANIALYAGAYTTCKRYSIANTWVGSLVGAIPPAMGWAAVSGTLDSGALALCALIYFWQFPHFNSLSYNVRADYCRAGYHMMSVVDPALNARVSLRNTLALIPLCAAIPFTGISHCSFSFYSLLVNAYFSYLAYNFYRDPNKTTARELFRFSLVYLPIVFGFLAIGYAFKERTVGDARHHGEGAYIKDLCPVVVLPEGSVDEKCCPVKGKRAVTSL